MFRQATNFHRYVMAMNDYVDLDSFKGRSHLRLSLIAFPTIPVIAVLLYSVVRLAQLGRYLAVGLAGLYGEVSYSGGLAQLVGSLQGERAAVAYAVVLAARCFTANTSLNALSCNQMYTSNQDISDSFQATDAVFTQILTLPRSATKPYLSDAQNVINLIRQNLPSPLPSSNAMTSSFLNDVIDETVSAYTSVILTLSHLLTLSFTDFNEIPGPVLSGACALAALTAAQEAAESQYVLGLKQLAAGEAINATQKLNLVRNDALLASRLWDAVLCAPDTTEVYAMFYQNRGGPKYLAGIATPQNSANDAPFSVYELMLRAALKGTFQNNTTLSMNAWNGTFAEYRAAFETMKDQIMQTSRVDGLDPEWYTTRGVIVFDIFVALLQIPMALLIYEDAVLTVRNVEKYSKTAKARDKDLMIEHERADNLLFQMLPKSVSDQLKHGRKVLAEEFESATIYFSDIVDFHESHADSEIPEMIEALCKIFRLLDEITDSHDVYKVETISDVYMVVSGVPARNDGRHVTEIANLSLEVLAAADNYVTHDNNKLSLRIGCHTGRCVAGVVGNKTPRYCLFGDTVNVASRMQSHGLPHKIHISQPTFEALSRTQEFVIEYRGPMTVKGKGLMDTYWLTGKAEAPQRPVAWEEQLSDAAPPSPDDSALCVCSMGSEGGPDPEVRPVTPPIN